MSLTLPMPPMLRPLQSTFLAATLLLAACQAKPSSAPVTTFYSHQGAEVLYRAAKYEAAQSMCTQAVQQIQSTQGPKSPQLAEPLVDLSVINLRLAQYPEAKKNLDHAEAVINRNDPTQARLVARLDNNKGWRLYVLGESESAQTIFENARAALQKHDPNDSLEMAELTNNLGVMIQDSASDLTKLNEARRLIDQAAQMRRRLSGENSPETAESVSNISALLFDIARAQLEAARNQTDLTNAARNIRASITAMENALELVNKVYSESNPDTAQPRITLALGYVLIGELDRAETQTKKALEITTRSLGPEHPEYAGELSALGLIYMRQTHYDRAEKAFVEALAINEKVYGPASSRVLSNLNSLERLYDVSGNITKLRDVKARIEKISNKDI